MTGRMVILAGALAWAGARAGAVIMGVIVWKLLGEKNVPLRRHAAVGADAEEHLHRRRGVLGDTLPLGAVRTSPAVYCAFRIPDSGFRRSEALSLANP